MCATVGFDASFDFGRTFFVDLLPIIVKKWVSLRLVDASKDSIMLYKEKSELGFVTPIGLPGEVVASFPGYARL